MWMTEYIAEIKRQFRDKYNFTPIGGTDHEPNFDSIPNGIYPMLIDGNDGKIDNVEVKDGNIKCCRFD